VLRLWGRDKGGRFRTHGHNSVTTVRGTRWFVQDSCKGTLTRVSQGLVSVRDKAKRKTFLVRAGRKYLAVPKRRR
jgi:ferric-dicitrate binding protein FerR (iron transport regulator)